MSFERHLMNCLLTRQTVEADALERPPVPEDAEALAVLMLDAYRGTIDGEGGTLDDARGEIQRLWNGEYGQFRPECSGVVEREGRPVSATLITLWKGLPFLSFSMTAPQWKRHGLARAGLKRAMNRLMDAGENRLRLVVTSGNVAAESLYRSLGFEVQEHDSV